MQEGGHVDPGVVVEDCLLVCANILSGSEMCQRLFFSMGASWRLILLGFFDVEQLESSSSQFVDLNDTDDDSRNTPSAWFNNSHKVKCAALAITVLINSLGNKSASKHQLILAKESSGAIIIASAYWCALNGPEELLSLSLSLIRAVIQNNAEALGYLNGYHIKVGNLKKGISIPISFSIPTFSFGSAVTGRADKHSISIMSLFVERYVTGENSIVWSALNADGPPVSRMNLQYLAAIDVVLAADPISTGLIMQYILAPPPPSIDESGFGEIDTGRPIGSIVIQLLVESCQRILLHLNNTSLTVTPNIADVRTVQKCSNILSLILIHGGLLARELSTAITVGHGLLFSSPGSNPSQQQSSVPILPFLLTVISRAFRMPSGSGYGLAISILRLLCAAGAGCHSSCKQVVLNFEHF